MRNPLSRKIVEIQPSGIRKFFDVANEMEDAISLGVGEPDFDTPWRIREEGMFSLEKGRTFYTSNAGLKELRKPLLHLHTQFNREIPYDTIDMDFMNENQAAHGDREYGHIFSRLNMERKVVAGYWEDEDVQKQIGSWMRTAVGVVESSHVRVMRVADNMRNVAVTEGDKVEAQIKFGWEVDAYPVNEVVEAVNAVSQADIDTLVEEYYDKYEILLEGRDEKEFREHVAVQAGIELGFERFLDENNYQAVVTHFGDLGGLKQLPGLAMQRLMEKGYGFGAEGNFIHGRLHIQPCIR